jgi:hypothetical protein
VVEDGRITELGSHDDLIEAGGAYAALWRSWHGPAPASPHDLGHFSPFEGEEVTKIPG